MATDGNWERTLQKLLNFDHLEKPVKRHVQNVYSCLAASMLVAAAGAYIHLMGIMQYGFLPMIAGLGLMIWLGVTPNTPDKRGQRFGMLLGFALTTGMSLGPLMDHVIRINPSIIPTAFLASTVIFGAFTLSSLLSEDRKWLYLGGTLFSALSWMLLGGLLNLFFRSTLLWQAELYIGLFVFCGFVLYDTQLIVEKRRRGDDDFIWHSVDLFIDFIQIFRRIMTILATKEERKKK